MRKILLVGCSSISALMLMQIADAGRAAGMEIVVVPDEGRICGNESRIHIDDLATIEVKEFKMLRSCVDDKPTHIWKKEPEPWQKKNKKYKGA
jgi:hypothetical protein